LIVVARERCGLATGCRKKLRPGGTMTDKNVDQAKGRVKEAAGALTGDRGLKNEGRTDQAKGSLKKAVDRLAETVKGDNRSEERNS
jgi:uncharacterized protein YjbJ (UPF0337 family)